MMRKLMLHSGIILMLLMVVAPFAGAKGPVDRVKITAADSEIEWLVTDEAVTPLLSMGGLEDLRLGVLADAPSNLGEGYELLRQFQHSGGAYITFDHVIYYPNPAGERGYIFYVGIENGWSEYDGHWFRTDPEGEAALQQVLGIDTLKSRLPSAWLRLIFRAE